MSRKGKGKPLLKYRRNSKQARANRSRRIAGVQRSKRHDN
jgi:hypothetical protein